MFEALARGALLGLAIAVVPGPVITTVVRYGLLQGLRGALPAVLGALTASVVHVTVAATAATLLDDKPWLLRVVWLCGGAILLLEGVRGFLPSRQAEQEGAEAGPRAGAYRSGLLVNLCNPLAVVLWAAILIVPPASLDEPQAVVRHWLFALGTWLGVVAWDATVAVLAAGGRRVLDARWTGRLIRLSALALAGFALWFLYRGLTGH